MSTKTVRRHQQTCRWFRFSVRSLLIAFLVIGLCCGNIARRARKQANAIQRIQELGGTVYFSFQKTKNPGGDYFYYDFTREDSCPQWLKRFLPVSFYAHVDGINLDETGIGDKDLAYIRAGLPNIGFLDLVDCPDITDEGLKAIGQFQNLWQLDISGTNITNEGLRHLSELSVLCSLDMNRCTTINDAGLRHVAQLPKLAALRLQDTGVTDEVFNILDFNRLRFLNLQGSKASLDTCKAMGLKYSETCLVSY